MRNTTLPRHPRTGLLALGYSKRGPIWPVLGGDGTGDGNTGDKTGDKTGEDGDGDKKTEDGDKKTEEPAKKAPVKVTETKEYKALQAELDAERQKHMSDDEKTRAAETKTAVDTAVSAKEIELTDHYTTIISGLQDQIVDATIDSALSGVGRKRDEFKTVLETLDKQRFLDEDGAVKTDDVKKWASELAGSSSSRPPPGTTSSSSSSDRGFGRYLNNK